MKSYKLEEFFKGWVVGDFNPSLFKNSDFEVAVKFFEKGDREPAHKQLIATEITIVVGGIIKLGEEIYSRGDIIEIQPNEITAFESLTQSSLVCIKFPSIPNDKVVV
jgi:quercetin dioxygenase-like cupin family protein